MEEFHCIECGADISDLPDKCPQCGHGYTYTVAQPQWQSVSLLSLLFWFLLLWFLIFVFPNLSD